jgi:hypothetical protein
MSVKFSCVYIKSRGINMATFATPTDVTDLFRNIDIESSESAITESKIQKWLDAAHSFVMGKVYTLYQKEITEENAPLSFAIIAQIEAMKVAAIVDDILNNYSEAMKKPQWEKRACAMLEEYVPDRDSKGNQPEPTVKLPDAIYIGTNIQQSSIRVSATTGATFVKGRDNW